MLSAGILRECCCCQEEAERVRWEIRELGGEVARLKQQLEEARRDRRDAVSKVGRRAGGRSHSHTQCMVVVRATNHHDAHVSVAASIARVPLPAPVHRWMLPSAQSLKPVQKSRTPSMSMLSCTASWQRGTLWLILCAASRDSRWKVEASNACCEPRTCSLQACPHYQLVKLAS
jgi:hypothetical protein